MQEKNRNECTQRELFRRPLLCKVELDFFRLMELNHLSLSKLSEIWT